MCRGTLTEPIVRAQGQNEERHPVNLRVKIDAVIRPLDVPPRLVLANAGMC